MSRRQKKKTLSTCDHDGDTSGNAAIGNREENSNVDNILEGWGGMTWEIGTDIHILLMLFIK